MPDLNALGFTPDEEIPADDITEIPESTGGYVFLQPGSHIFQLPPTDKGFTTDGWYEAGFFKKIVVQNKEYLQLTLRGGQDQDGNKKGYPLRVKSGGLYGTQFNNLPDFRPNKDGKKFNDLLRLLRALGHKETPRTNQQYLDALLQYPDAFFGAKVTLSTKATKDRNGFNASFASWVYDANKRNGDPLDKPYTAQNGNVTLPLLPDKKGFGEEIEIANPTTGEAVTLRVFGNLRDFFSVSNGNH